MVRRLLGFHDTVLILIVISKPSKDQATRVQRYIATTLDHQWEPSPNHPKKQKKKKKKKKKNHSNAGLCLWLGEGKIFSPNMHLVRGHNRQSNQNPIVCAI
ncbi:hypothetical protein ACKS23_06856 [Histoplasma ohiense]